MWTWRPRKVLRFRRTSWHGSPPWPPPTRGCRCRPKWGTGSGFRGRDELAKFGPKCLLPPRTTMIHNQWSRPFYNRSCSICTRMRWQPVGFSPPRTRSSSARRDVGRINALPVFASQSPPRQTAAHGQRPRPRQQSKIQIDPDPTPHMFLAVLERAS